MTTDALAMLFPALMLAGKVPLVAAADYGFVAIVLALALLGALRGWAIYPAVFSAVGAVAGTVAMSAMPVGLFIDTLGVIAPPTFDGATLPVPVLGSVPVGLLLALAVAYAAVGLAAVRLRLAGSNLFAAIWSLLAPAVPLAILTFGNLSFDLKHGLLAVVLGLVFLGAAEAFSRGRQETEGVFVPQWALAAGGFDTLYAQCLRHPAAHAGIARKERLRRSASAFGASSIAATSWRAASSRARH